MSIFPAPSEERRCELLVTFTTAIKTCEEDWSICLEPITDNGGHQLPLCKHFYHYQCLLTWTEQNSTCPMCRQEMFVPAKPERKWAVPFDTGDLIISEAVYQQWRESEGGEEEVRNFKEISEEEIVVGELEFGSRGEVGWW
ncbi:hypothetical protein HBI71_163790 [Parastagonospora nodorum]|nr:hypothetical protein HBI71_163790 [Parastagonospora nodorum]